MGRVRINEWEFADAQVVTFLGGTLSANLQIPIKGWDWFMLASLTTSFDNSGGGGLSLPVLLLSSNQGTIYASPMPTGVPGGSSASLSWGIGYSATGDATLFMAAAIPTTAVIGEGLVTLEAVGVGIGSLFESGSLYIIGQVHRGGSPKG